VSAEAGKAAFEAITKAIDLALEGKADAVVTNPIHKEAINLAGYHYSGHTEIFADKTGSKSYAMMLAVDNFRVVHVSTHVSLKEAVERVKKERVCEVIKLAHQALVDLGIENPRIGVAALNPHAGEGGLFGREEIEEIEPAIKEAQKEGINATGPYPADTVFSKAYGGAFDAVVVMYHDQGHIPIKMVGFKWDESKRMWVKVKGINVTLGLPIIRTSVDHGVAFGKAWRTGTADETSLLDAIDYAIRLAEGKRRRSA
jgi:4-hydroxythreonine-4-phosphate dehydrogenase